MLRGDLACPGSFNLGRGFHCSCPMAGWGMIDFEAAGAAARQIDRRVARNRRMPGVGDSELLRQHLRERRGVSLAVSSSVPGDEC